MLKMLMDPMGGIVMTNDGNAILREITVQHPAAKSLIEIARTQDEEVGDGTTSVIVLAGEILSVAEPSLQQQVHPTVIIRAFREALEEIITMLEGPFSIALDPNDKNRLQDVVSIQLNKLFNRFLNGAVLCFRLNHALEQNSLDAGLIWLLKLHWMQLKQFYLPKTDEPRLTSSGMRKWKKFPAVQLMNLAF